MMIERFFFNFNYDSFDQIWIHFLLKLFLENNFQNLKLPVTSRNSSNSLEVIFIYYLFSDQSISFHMRINDINSKFKFTWWLVFILPKKEKKVLKGVDWSCHKVTSLQKWICIFKFESSQCCMFGCTSFDIKPTQDLKSISALLRGLKINV